MSRVLPVALLLLALATPAWSGGWNPEGWEHPAMKSDESAESATSPVGLALNALLGFYRGFISPIGASDCPSFPSCSTYSLAAIKRHGPLAGTVLTAARLVSEADEAAFSRWVYVGGQPKVWYPLEGTVILEEKIDR